MNVLASQQLYSCLKLARLTHLQHWKRRHLYRMKEKYLYWRKKNILKFCTLVYKFIWNWYKYKSFSRITISVHCKREELSRALTECQNLVVKRTYTHIYHKTVCICLLWHVMMMLIFFFLEKFTFAEINLLMARLCKMCARFHNEYDLKRITELICANQKY